MAHDVHEVELAPLPRKAWLCLAAIAAALLLAGLVPPGRILPGPWWPLVPFGLALLVAASAVALRRRRVTLQGDELVVAATFYTRRIPVRSLALAQARVVDLAEHVELRPWLGGNRFDLPGFHAGYSLLRNRRRAFCLVTARERVLVLPEHGGRLLLLSPRQPRDLLARLGRIAQAAAHG